MLKSYFKYIALLTLCAVGVVGQISPPSGGSTPSGPAGGDLSGTYPNPTVVNINGVAVPASQSCLGSNSGRQLITGTCVSPNQSNTYSTGIQDFTSATSALVSTQTAGDSSTKAASTSFVGTAINNAIAGVNPAIAVQAATAAVLPNSPTYANGASGVGATLTAGSAAALVVDGYTPVLLDRILVKNQASSFQNGVYTLSTLGTGVIPYVLTRALDFNQPSDINNTGAIPVLNGTVNTTTSWVVSSKVTTVGTDAITFTQFSINPANVTQTIASGTSALGTGAISSATCATVVTTSATGTATTDVVSASFNADPTAVTGYIPSTSGMLTIIGYPTTNNVNWKVCNNTGGSITPGAITLNWRVTR